MENEDVLLSIIDALELRIKLLSIELDDLKRRMTDLENKDESEG